MRLLLFNLVTDSDDPILGFTTRWIIALARRAEVVHVITMRAGRVEVPDNVRVHSVGKERGYGRPRRVWEFYRLLAGILRRERIDACFAHMMPLFTVLGAPLLKSKGIPIVTWYVHPKMSRTLKLAHRCSDRMATSIPTSYPYRHDKLAVVGHGIDTELFSPAGGVSIDEPPMILCVGRLSPVKDHATLLRAAQLLHRRRERPFRVVFIGGPATARDEVYARSLCGSVRELGLGEIVSFLAPMPIVELPAWYRRCAVHVNMTAVGSADKVAWEAMSCGVPCIVANAGFTETLGASAKTLLFSYGDAQALADRLDAMLRLSKGERDEIGAFLRGQVVRLHGLDRLAERLMEMLFELTGPRRHIRAARPMPAPSPAAARLNGRNHSDADGELLR